MQLDYILRALEVDFTSGTYLLPTVRVAPRLLVAWSLEPPLRLAIEQDEPSRASTQLVFWVLSQVGRCHRQ
jgi:hypothetical protein